MSDEIENMIVAATPQPRNPKLIADARLKDAVPIQALPGLKVWTDHHNNLFDVLR